MADFLYFSTAWCGPCKMFKPIVQGVAAETGTNVQFVDAEQNQALAAQYSITSVPTIIVSQNGQTIHRHSGVMSKQQVASLFQTHK
jgi:thioredoxin 1